MAIVVECKCGGKFQAKDELAGKQLKCPQCKSAITVGQPRSPQQQQPTGKLNVQCKCGKKYQVKPELAGQTLKCSACQSPITIPTGKPKQTQRQQPAGGGNGQIKVKCSCGQIYTVKASMAGKGVKCQKCGSAMKIPGGTAPARQPAAQQSAADPLSDPLGGSFGDPFADDLGALQDAGGGFDDPLGGAMGNDPLGGPLASAPSPAFQPQGYQPQSASPQKSQGGGKSNLPLILGIGGGVAALLLLLVGAGVGAMFMFSGGGNNTPIASNTDGDTDTTPTDAAPGDGSNADSTPTDSSNADGPSDTTEPDPPGDNTNSNNVATGIGFLNKNHEMAMIVDWKQLRDTTIIKSIKPNEPFIFGSDRPLKINDFRQEIARVEMYTGKTPQGFVRASYYQFVDPQKFAAWKKRYNLNQQGKKTAGGKNYYQQDSRRSIVLLNEQNAFCIGDEATIKSALENNLAARDTRLKKRLDQAKGAFIIATADKPGGESTLNSLIDEILNGPAGQNILEFPESIHESTIEFHPDAQQVIRVSLDGENPAAAIAAKKTFESWLDNWGAVFSVLPKTDDTKFLTMLGSMAQNNSVTASANAMNAQFERPDGFSQIVAAFNSMRNVASRPPETSDENKAKYLILAVLNYRDVHRKAPTDIVDQGSGDKLLSWRVELLPYLELEHVYDKIDRSKSWSQQPNLDLMHSVDFFKTKYATSEQGTTWQIVPDPKSTIQLVMGTYESSQKWSEPDQGVYKPDDPARTFGPEPADGYLVAYRNGVVKRIPLAELKAGLGGGGGGTTKPPAGDTMPSTEITLAPYSMKFGGRGKLPGSSKVEKITCEQFEEQIGSTYDRVSANDVQAHASTVFEISGVVNDLDTQPRNGGFEMELKMRTDERSSKEVLCLFRNEQIWKNLKKGDKVTVRGQLNDRPDYQSKRQVLDFGELVSGGDKGPPAMTADQMSKYATDSRREISRRYTQQFLLQGKVKEFKPKTDSNRDATVVFEVNGETGVEVQLGTNYRETKSGVIKPGQEVIMLCTVHGQLAIEYPDKIVFTSGSFLSVK